MGFKLEIDAGPLKGRAAILAHGESLEVGRLSCGFAVSSDAAMSARHFVIRCSSKGKLTLLDLQSTNGTYVNGRRATETELQAGDRLEAGDTVFTVDEAPTTRVVCQTIETASPLETLQSQDGLLYALLDAARDNVILRLLVEHSDQCRYQSLYNGKSAEELATYAPYLVNIAATSPLLAALIGQGWGHSWGIYLLSSASFENIRKHLRRFIMADLDGLPVYFRFYDPRVLRAYMPTCTLDEAVEFLGPIDELLMEDRDPDKLLSFSRERAETTETSVGSEPTDLGGLARETG